jgi:CopG family nickel-responsive transcriptional regulator
MFLNKIVRVGVTFPPELLRDFDEFIKKMGYDNRSKAIQDSVLFFISEYKSLEKETGQGVGVLSILYDHKAKGLEEKLTDIQHEFSEIIRSTMHVHLNKNDCLQVITIDGNIKNIKKLIKKLMINKGVKQAKLSLIKSRV